jgi:phage shock protein E
MARKHVKQKNKQRKLTWLWVGLGVIFLAIVVISLLHSPATNNVDNKSTPTSSLVEISPAEAYVKFQEGAFFLDVRSQEEYDQFHIQGSNLIPLDQLQGRLNELPRDKDIVVVCLSGHRSLTGTDILQQAGFSNVFCLSGGLTAWRSAGYPLEGQMP